jgi:hypothetical protein
LQWMYGRVEVSAFLTLVIDGGEQSASCPNHIIPNERPQYPLNRGWTGLFACLGAAKKRRVCCFYHKTNPDSSIIQPSHLTELSQQYTGVPLAFEPEDVGIISQMKHSTA